MRQPPQLIQLSRLRWSLAAGLLLLALAGTLPAAAAASKSKTTNSSSQSTSQTNSSADISSDISQSYNAGAGVQPGIIVELDSKNPQTVIPLSRNDINRMLGVVIPTSSANIILSPTTGSQQQVLVATTGRLQVLVSSENGPIRVGDYITISSIDGIGMDASTDQSEVIGRAGTSFSGTGSSLGTANLQGQSSATKVNIGSVLLILGVSQNPLAQRDVSYVPAFFTKVASGVSDKPVSPLRLYISMVMLLITAIVAVSILYASVRGSMIALGRNPLSKQPILRGLLEAMLLVLIIFAAGVFAVYLLLKL